MGVEIPKVRSIWPEEQQSAYRRIACILGQFSNRIQIQIVDQLSKAVRTPEDPSHKEFLKRLDEILKKEG